MTDADLIAGVGAFFLPLLVAVVQRQSWPDWVRALVGFAGICAWTALVMWFTGGLPVLADARAWVRTALVVAVTSWSSYQALWKPTIGPGWERMTTPKGKR